MLLRRQIVNVVIGRISTSHCNSVLFNLNTKQVRKMASSTGASTSTCTQSATKSVIAVCQMRSTCDKEANAKIVEELVHRAKEKNATFIFFPECCDFIGDTRAQTLDLAEPLSGPLMQSYRKLAKDNKMYISLGGIHESILDKDGKKTDKIYNTHIILTDNGDIVGKYRKLHLFDVNTPDHHFRESDVVTHGSRFVPPVRTPIGCVSMQICYDIRFAEYGVLQRKSGADILTYPSAFAYSTGRAHWEVLVRARAIENQCFVVAAAQIGFHNAKRQSWGHAMIVNPWGKITVDVGTDEVAVSVAEIDLNTIASIKKSMPCSEHRRHDIYSLIGYGAGKGEGTQDRHFATHNIPKETIFFETKYIFAFTNIRCVVPGHILVSTKRVIPRLTNLKCEEMADLFIVVCKMQRMLESIYKTKSSTVTVQDGADAGQTVPHVHFHVMPRRPGDFEPNDKIYTKLDDNSENAVDRELSERIEEAEKYRKYLNTHK